MFKKMFALVPLLLLFGLFNSASLSFAEETTKKENIEKAKDYIENNVTELNEILSSMEKQQNVFDLQKVQAVIDNYYSKNPAPQEVVNDKSLSIDDVFPLENKNNIKKEEVLDFEQLISDAKEDLAEGDSIYEFSNKDGVVTVYVSKTGEVMILDRSTVPTLNFDKNENDLITTAAAWKTTRTERTTGIAYNGLGLKMFTIWAEGNFQYNGTSAKHLNFNGDVQRHFWGSTLVLQNRAVGKTRTATAGSYSYPEVYTRVYFEAQFGVRWAGITMNSATVEAYVGASHTGSLYGGTKRL